MCSVTSILCIRRYSDVISLLLRFFFRMGVASPAHRMYDWCETLCVHLCVCVDQRVEWVRVEREMDQKNKIKVGTAMGWVPHLVFFFSVLSWALCLLFSKEN